MFVDSPRLIYAGQLSELYLTILYFAAHLDLICRFENFYNEISCMNMK